MSTAVMITRRPIPVTITLWLGWAWTFIFFSNLQTMVYLGDLWFWGLTLTVTALLSVFFFECTLAAFT